jgi:uncharacterized membrane protein (DUF4010 family)
MLTDLTLTANDLPELMARFALALALGILVGSERERSTDDPTAPGVRTFAILSLFGASAAVFGPVVLAVTILAAAAVTLAPVLRGRTEGEPVGYGATTLAAAVLTPLLGGLAVALPALAAAVAVTLTVALVTKKRIHRFVRTTVTRAELIDALKFFVVALVALPLLPDQAYGPYEVINPHRIGLLVTALTGIGWLGYIAVRAFGASRGLPLAGLAGGLVSSTATTAAMVRKARDAELRRPAIAAALLSKVSSLATLTALIAAISLDALAVLAVPIAVMAAALLITSRLFARHARRTAPTPVTAQVAALDGSGSDEEPDVAARAFALKPALILAGVITAALLLSKAAAELIGSGAVVAVAAVTGTVDTHAATLALTTLAADGHLAPVITMLGVAAALTTSTVFKVVLAFIAGGRQIGALTALALAPATVAMAAAAAVTAAVVGLP